MWKQACKTPLKVCMTGDAKRAPSCRGRYKSSQLSEFVPICHNEGGLSIFFHVTLPGWRDDVVSCALESHRGWTRDLNRCKTPGLTVLSSLPPHYLTKELTCHMTNLYQPHLHKTQWSPHFCFDYFLEIKLYLFSQSFPYFIMSLHCFEGGCYLWV